MSDKTRGAQRVAAFLLSLDGETATRVLSTLAPDVVDDVAQAMLAIPGELADPKRVDELRREIALAANSPKPVRSCGDDELTGLLKSAFGAERGGEVLSVIRERRLQERPFLELESASPFTLRTMLQSESPAVCALVLAHLPPSLSAGVLDGFEHDAALNIVRRMATLTPPPFDVLRRLALSLQERIEAASASGPPPDESARLKTIAELLSNSDPQMEKSVIEAIEEEDIDMAEELREFLFTWEDIGTIDKRSMQKILGSVDTKTLSMGLKGCSEAVEENIMNNLSSRVREMVAEERDLIGAVPLADVLTAREEVMRNVRALIEAGEFRPTRGGEELVE